ncbi:MAG: adenosine deaminase [Butyrivibrio sp.]|nr:adenosine deaminase [Butyrivibrio sp.]
MYELHLHLDGSLRPSTVLQLAQLQSDVDPKINAENIARRLTVPDSCTSLTAYLDCFSLPLQLLQTEEALERAVYELAEDLFHEGLTYAELRFAPAPLTHQGLSQKAVTIAAVQGARKAMQKYPDIRIGLILCCMRGKNLKKENTETIKTAAMLRGDIVCGIDLAGAEAIFPTADYADLFRLAASLDIPFTIHAGEAAGPDSIRTALSFGAKRIGHGVRAIEDPSLIEELIKKGTTLEVCLKSNFDTHCFASEKEHPIRRLFDAGVKVTLNSDNRTVSGTCLANEIRIAKEMFGFTDTEIMQMQEYAREAAFNPIVRP